MPLSDFLQSHGDEAPSGENLEYDPAFISLELAAQPGEERQVGDSIIPAEEPDWPEVLTQANDVLGRSHDLRAAVFVAHAYLRTKGFSGFAEALGLIRGMVEQFWDTCHPQLDADDDNDPTMRVNAVLALCGPDGSPSAILRDVRYAPLTDSRSFGKLCMRDVLIAQGDMAPPSAEYTVLDVSQISAAFSDTDPDKALAIRAAVEQAKADVRAIQVAFDERAPGNSMDLKPLERLLYQVLQQFDGAGIGASDGDGEGAEGDGADEGGGGDEGASARGGGGGRSQGGPGTINNQNDVRTTLDRLIAYYAKVEPSSPVPVLLDRAKRLVGADFLSIIKDMAPDGESQVMWIAGVKEKSEYD